MFTHSFEYIDNLAGQFIKLQRTKSDGSYSKAVKQLNQAYNDKHHTKSSDRDLNEFVSFDYTPVSDGKQSTSWFEREFRHSRPFDPAQMNFVILNSPLIR